MNYTNKGKAKKILAWSLPLLFILLTYHFEGFASFRNYNIKQSVSDTPPPVKILPDSALTLIKKRTDTLRKPFIGEEKKQLDTTFLNVSDTFSFKRSKDTLNAPVVYHADDSMVFDVPSKKMILYGKVSSIKYSDNNLSAPQIEFDQRTSIVKAFLKKDTSGKVLSYPFFSQADFESVSDTIEVNMKTGKGLTKGTYTKQGEIFVYGDRIKKIDSAAFYVLRARFTTCNLDTPHFAFIAKKIKFVNKKWAYSGPVHPEFEGVPLPIQLPFGIFPLTQGRHSGLLAPSFTANDQLGLTLDNLGYYKIISPTWDLVSRGSVYSYGSWKANFNARYYRRYHFRGDISFDIQKIKPLDEKGSPTFHVGWNHNADTKSRPGTTFSANVNASSSKYNSQVPNSPVTNFTNQLYSSIAYSKVWKNRPYNISINANHDQNTATKQINLKFPDVSFNVNTQYPFRKKEPVGDLKWYENIGIGYNGAARSLTSFYDTAGNVGKQLSDNFQYGARHSVPISLSLPPLGVFQVAPGVTYEESWYQRKTFRSYNPLKKAEDTVTSNGFFTARQMTFSISFSTRIFGMYGFGKNSRVKAIRHEIRPSITANYAPNFNAKNYYRARLDSFGTISDRSYFENPVSGSVYSNQKTGGLGFSIDNIVTMKKKDKTDTAAKADKKITLIDGLRLDGFYNFLRDSFKLEPLTVSFRSNIGEKVNLTAGAVFNPYQTDARGRNIDKLIWSKNPFTLGQLVSGTVQMQSSFKGGDKKNKTDNNSQQNTALNNIDARTGLPLDEYQREASYIQNNPGEFVDFEIPYQADFSYSLVATRFFDPAATKFKTTLTQSVTGNTSANLSPKWKIGVNGVYNVSLKKIETVSMYLSRDMHCWQMAINISPVGIYRFFSINISPKSGMLRDLKINRTRSFYDTP